MHLPDAQPKFDVHPDRLRALAILFNLPEPAKVEQAQIVFLGVSHGANVLAIASEYPHANITAVTTSPTYSQRLQDAIEHLQLHNVHIVSVDEWLEYTFKSPVDYVICHGYFSYLNDADKQRHIERIAHIVRPQSLIYINYLTQPGWQVFESLQYLLSQTSSVSNIEHLNEETLNHSINLIYRYLSEGHPLRNSIDQIVPYMNVHSHPALNGYWPLKAAHSDTPDVFIQRLHTERLGYVCDSDIKRYYFQNLPTDIKTHCGKNTHLMENLYDILHFQASRASIIMPITQLVGFYLPTREDMLNRLPLLHISGHFELNANRTEWRSSIDPSLNVVATALNSLLIESINRVHQAHSTLSVAKILDLMQKKFKNVPDIVNVGATLILDLILSNALHVRSQRHSCFQHQASVLALHTWRQSHNPALQLANKWLIPLSAKDIELMQAEYAENQAETTETNAS